MLLSFAPIALLVLLLFSAVQLFGADASYGPNQVALLIASACAGVVGMYRGMSWAEVQDGMVDGIKVGLGPILILLAVGGLIGSWMIAGTVPAMIYYGVSILDPDIFFAAAARLSEFYSRRHCSQSRRGRNDAGENDGQLAGSTNAV